MEQDNPLLEPILTLLRQVQRWKLHELMLELKTQQLLPQWPVPEELALFRTNFLLMNALYHLQRLLLPQGYWLDVVPLDLQLRTCHSPTLPAPADPLASYYLDWTNCEQADLDEVQTLLNAFWHHYAERVVCYQLTRAEACRLLEVDESATSAQIRRSWKRLALRHHPDRGGDVGRFLRIRQAWARLKVDDDKLVPVMPETGY